MHLRIGDNGPSLVGALSERGPSRARPSSGDADDGGSSSDTAAGVVVRLSPEARQRLGGQGAGAPAGDAQKTDAPADDGAATGEAKGPGEKLTPKQEEVVRKLEARDTAVRAHEAAHMAAAGGLGGGASYTFQVGPDGQRYAVGGEVSVQLASGRTPDETIQNAETVRAAALAPADPSAQDLAVAAQASQMEAQARQQKSDQQHQASADQVGGARSTDPLHDSLMVFSAIKAERGATSGGVGHMHSGGDCAFCRAAAGKYA